MHIFFIEAGYFAYQSRDAAAELKSRALSSGGAAEEVRYNSRDKYQRSEQRRHALR